MYMKRNMNLILQIKLIHMKINLKNEKEFSVKLYSYEQK